MSLIFGENAAMDTFLQQLVENKQFELLSNKNWDAVSHMFPGTTPYQVKIYLSPFNFTLSLLSWVGRVHLTCMFYS